MALDQARLDQQLEVPGDARLRLAQDGDELADGQLGLGKQRQQPQPRSFAGSLEGRQGRGERKMMLGHQSPALEK